MDQTVVMDDREWSQVMSVLANSNGFAWAITNPLLMKMGAQLKDQTQLSPQPPDHAPEIVTRANGLDLDPTPQPAPPRRSVPRG